MAEGLNCVVREIVNLLYFT